MVASLGSQIPLKSSAWLEHPKSFWGVGAAGVDGVEGFIRGPMPSVLLCSGLGRQSGDAAISVEIVSGDDVHQSIEGDHAQQILADLAGIMVGELAHQPWPFDSSAYAVKLPGQIADEGVSRAGGHGPLEEITIESSR